MNDYVGNRLVARIPYKLKIKLKGRNFKESIYYTADISAGGVFIPSETAPPLGLAVELKIYLPVSKNPLKIHGKIQRIKWAGNFERVEGFAVEFKKIDRKTEDKYLNFINKISKGEL